MQEIVSLISSKGDPHLSQTVPNWTRAPWLEQHYFAAILKTLSTTPRVITTHLPHRLLGPTLQGSKLKVKFTRLITVELETIELFFFSNVNCSVCVFVIYLSIHLNKRSRLIVCYWIFNITPNFNNMIRTIWLCSADVTSCRSSMWAETPKMWWCPFTTSTKWPLSSLKSAHFKSFYINSWREHVSWRHTDFSSVAPKNNLIKYCI